MPLGKWMGVFPLDIPNMGRGCVPLALRLVRGQKDPVRELDYPHPPSPDTVNRVGISKDSNNQRGTPTDKAAAVSAMQLELASAGSGLAKC